MLNPTYNNVPKSLGAYAICFDNVEVVNGAPGVPSLQSSWLGIAAAVGLYLNGVLDLFNAGEPVGTKLLIGIGPEMIPDVPPVMKPDDAVLLAVGGTAVPFRSPPFGLMSPGGIEEVMLLVEEDDAR